jgi:hypothetical protein
MTLSLLGSGGGFINSAIISAYVFFGIFEIKIYYIISFNFLFVYYICQIQKGQRMQLVKRKTLGTLGTNVRIETDQATRLDPA